MPATTAFTLIPSSRGPGLKISHSRARRETELGAYKHRAQALDATRLTARDQRLVYIAASR